VTGLGWRRAQAWAGGCGGGRRQQGGNWRWSMTARRGNGSRRHQRFTRSQESRRSARFTRSMNLKDARRTERNRINIRGLNQGQIGWARVRYSWTKIELCGVAPGRPWRVILSCLGFFYSRNCISSSAVHCPCTFGSVIVSVLTFWNNISLRGRNAYVSSCINII
jgi:hypothetical protein